MNNIASRRPQPEEFAETLSASVYQRDQVEKVDGECALAVLRGQLHWICELTGHLSTGQIDRIHAPYSWTIRQVLAHCLDAERVFGYRMMRIAAGDSTPLPGWDENAYADSRFGLGNFTNLTSELVALRQSNLWLLQRIVPQAWDRSAEVSGNRMTVRAIAWLTAGHLQHHFQIIEERCETKVARTPPPMMPPQEPAKASTETPMSS
ncbi:DinB superfamily protein [Rubripirellula lacrimiformis]|uniref:DinB superfamily protein n=1 Tax=Rubripirellula lacrimiformis TaxID=1930273 RepID=A0A517NL24_9BACT|nr:DinB family protein [Rubripirellula lacrimiformis]QDT07842.1 DinB superfamily protein [Rubripirellula lacrimiformis]